MLRVKGVYDGTKVVLLSKVSLPPNTAVEVVVAEHPTEPEQLYWQRLIDLGLIKQVQVAAASERPSFTPVPVTGAPLSQTIIEERR